MGRPHAKIKRQKKSSRRPRKERHQHTRIEESALTGNFPLREIEHRRRPFFAPPLSIRGAYYCARELSGLFGKGKDEGVFWWHGGGGGREERKINTAHNSLCANSPAGGGEGKRKRKEKSGKLPRKKKLSRAFVRRSTGGAKKERGGGESIASGCLGGERKAGEGGSNHIFSALLFSRGSSARSSTIFPFRRRPIDSAEGQTYELTGSDAPIDYGTFPFLLLLSLFLSIVRGAATPFV